MRSAVQGFCGDDFITRLQDREKRNQLRRHAGGNCDTRTSPLKRRHPLFKYGVGRIHDASVDVSERL